MSTLPPSLPSNVEGAEEEEEEKCPLLCWQACVSYLCCDVEMDPRGASLLANLFFAADHRPAPRKKK